MVEFTAGTTERSGAESVPNLVFLLAASYVPANNEGQLDYQITGGADAALFELINDAQGEDNWAHLVLVGKNWSDDLVDYETKLDADGDGKYAVDVTVTSTLNGAQSTSTFFIAVNDVTIDYWMQAALSYGTDVAVTNVLNATIEEGAANGTQLFEAFSTDGSGSPVYSLTADSSNGAFEIDAFTGIVSVKNGLLIDYETMGSGYVITVKATESATDFVTQDFNIGNSFITITDASDVGETITGTNGTDKITPLATVTGQPFPTVKDDNIDGGKGNDHIDGWLGADRLNGGLGIDTVGYASSFAGVTVNLQQQGTSSVTGAPIADGSAQSVGAAQGDLLWGFENILGSTKSDTLTGDQFANLIEGSDGDDTLDGGGGIDTLRGDTGNDKIAGNTGNDMLDGGTNTAAGDTLDYSYLAAGQNLSLTLGAYNSTTKSVTQSSAVVKFGAVTLETDGVKNFENVTGGIGNDTLTGNAGANVLDGFEGDDLLKGGAGADTLIGGAGTDTASYATSAAGVFVDLNVQNGSAQAATHDFGDGKGAVANGDAAGDILTGIENFTGSSKNDVVSASDDVNLLNGGAGTSDTVSYANSVGGIEIDLSKQFTVSTTGVFSVVGTLGIGGHAQDDKLAGFENIIGGGGDDIITGNDGANVIEGGDGIDTLDGGKGIDTVSYANATGNVTVLLNGASLGSGSAYGDFDKLFNFENVIGSDYDDQFEGDSAINILVGGAGADTFLSGGGGADTFDGGAGTDHAMFSAETFGLTILLGKDGASATVKAAAGSNAAGDKLISIEQVTGGSGNDVLTGNNVAVNFSGSGGNDTLTGSTQNDVLNGGSDNDVFYVTLGSDVLLGGDGMDTLNMSKMTVGMIANIAGVGYSDVATGTAISGTLLDFESIIGTAKDDQLRGATNALSTLNGADGNDIIEGGNKFDTVGDTLIGGKGTDTLSYANSAAGVSVTLRAGLSAITGTGGDDKGDVATGFENLIGSANIDTLTGDSGANVIEGGKGADTLVGGGGNDTLSYAGSGNGVTVTLDGPVNEAIIEGTGHDAEGDDAVGFINLVGSADNDKLTGDTRSNVITGGGGDDTLTGGLGADTLDGGAGHDTVSYNLDTAGLTVTLGKNGASATVTGGTGSSAKGDKLISIEQITGSSGVDKLTGNDLFHQFDGGDGNDTLAGGTGSSTLNGQAGDDTILGSAGAIEIYNGGNTGETNGDTLSFAKITTFGVDVNLNTANLSSIGLGAGIGSGQAFGFEILVGGSKNDVLTGNPFTATKIDGGAGADTITGGSDVDTLKGGAGNDTFVLADENQGKDFFTDFTNGDKLQINKAGFGGGLSGATLTADYFVLGPAATVAGHGQFVYNTVTDTLSWDDDGSGGNAAVDIGQFGSAVVLKLADFALI